jgi:hypothetical protein
MMARRGAGASPVPHASLDASYQSLDVPYYLASPGQGEEAPESSLGLPELGTGPGAECTVLKFRPLNTTLLHIESE